MQRAFCCVADSEQHINSPPAHEALKSSASSVLKGVLHSKLATSSSLGPQHRANEYKASLHTASARTVLAKKVARTK
jgi:hypothetical protein